MDESPVSIRQYKPTSVIVSSRRGCQVSSPNLRKSEHSTPIMSTDFRLKLAQMKHIQNNDVQQIINQPSYESRVKMNDAIIERQKSTRNLSNDFSSNRRIVTLRRIDSIAVKGSEYTTNIRMEIANVNRSNRSKSEEKYHANFFSSVVSDHESLILPNTVLTKSQDKTCHPAVEEENTEVKKIGSTILNDIEKLPSLVENNENTNSSSTVFQLIYKDSIRRSKLNNDLKNLKRPIIKEFDRIRGSYKNESSVIIKEMLSGGDQSTKKSVAGHSRALTNDISAQAKNQNTSPHVSSQLLNLQLTLPVPEQKPVRMNLIQARNIQIQESYRKAQRKLIRIKTEVSPIRQIKVNEDLTVHEVPKFLTKRDDSESRILNLEDGIVKSEKETVEQEVKTNTLPQIQTPSQQPQILSHVSALSHSQIAQFQMAMKTFSQSCEVQKSVLPSLQPEDKTPKKTHRRLVTKTEESPDTPKKEVLISYKSKRGECYINRKRLSTEFLVALASKGLASKDEGPSDKTLDVSQSMIDTEETLREMLTT